MERVENKKLTTRDRFWGHVRTVGPFLSRSIRPEVRPSTRFWEREWPAAEGTVRLSGEWLDCESEDVLVVVHGLGGSSASGYMALALHAAARQKRSCLLLNLRGADRQGQDFYHAGLTEDLARVVQSPELSSFRKIDLLGYSLGGHVVLRYATEQVDARVRSVAAVSSPLDLARSAEAFDQGRWNIYRSHVMGSLHEMYTAAYQRRPGPVLPTEARKIQKIREWDERIVAPRYGFASAQDYYDSVSVAPRLTSLSVPSLYVGSPADPMVPPVAVPLTQTYENLHAVWIPQAGHLGFPRDCDLGQPGPKGLEDQILTWAARQ